MQERERESESRPKMAGHEGSPKCAHEKEENVHGGASVREKRERERTREREREREVRKREKERERTDRKRSRGQAEMRTREGGKCARGSEREREARK